MRKNPFQKEVTLVSLKQSKADASPLQTSLAQMFAVQTIQGAQMQQMKE